MKRRSFLRADELRVALFQESAGNKTLWVAQCLDYNLAAQGQTPELAQRSFKRVLIDYVSLCVHKGIMPFSNIVSVRPKDPESEME